jgi:hypothetical protein
VSGDRDLDEIYFDLCKVLDFAIYGKLPEVPPVSVSSLYCHDDKSLFNILQNLKHSFNNNKIWFSKTHARLDKHFCLSPLYVYNEESVRNVQ